MSTETVCESRRYFSLTEANAILPRLKYYLGEMARLQRSVNGIFRRAVTLGVELSEDMSFDHLEDDDPSVDYFKRQLFDISEEYIGYVEKIGTLGVEIEDVDHGIVKMYSWQNGDEICLSWQYGEDGVNFWYKSHENYIVRRPLKGKSSKRPTALSMH